MQLSRAERAGALGGRVPDKAGLHPVELWIE